MLEKEYSITKSGTFGLCETMFALQPQKDIDKKLRKTIEMIIH